MIKKQVDMGWVVRSRTNRSSSHPSSSPGLSHNVVFLGDSLNFHSTPGYGV